MKKIISCLWFDTEAKEAAEFYTSIFNTYYIYKIDELRPSLVEKD